MKPIIIKSMLLIAAMAITVCCAQNHAIAKSASLAEWGDDEREDPGAPPEGGDCLLGDLNL